LSKRSPRTAKTVSERPVPRLWFFDASALAKAYLDEPETSQVERLMASGRPAVSRLSEVEVSSAVHRRWREGALPAQRRDAALAAFREDVLGWFVIELTAQVAARAALLLASHQLRAGDAIQLASALEARDGAPRDFACFVAYDARLLAAARAEGLPIEDY
jgi:predicted nucleic acid-binding protein